MTGNKEDKKEELIGDIKSWYNGYSWDGENFLYNPLSILNFFQEKKFGNYWFETGTTSFLLKLIKNYDVDIKELDNYKSGEAIFDSFEPDNINVVSLLFQTGYLTLKNVESIDRVRYLYTFSYPNIEVKEAFMKNLLGYFSSRFANEVSVIIYELKKQLLQNQIESFIETLKTIFAKISYDIFIKDREAYYHTQVRKNKYYERYEDSRKKIKIIGIGFDAEERNIKDFKVEDVTRGK